MVANNKVDSLSYDVEAPPPAAAAAAPPPASSSPAPARPAAPVTRQGTASASASVLELHKVSVPERRTTAKALRQRLAEVFFPDDPLHQFKNQSSARRLVLALQYFFPIFQWGSAYSRSLLRSDLIAGLTIASLAIPQARALLSPASPPLPRLHSFPSYFWHGLLWHGPEYRPAGVRRVITTSNTVAVVAVAVQGISYAKLANLPPIIGLCEFLRDAPANSKLVGAISISEPCLVHACKQIPALCRRSSTRCWGARGTWRWGRSPSRRW